MYSVLTPSTSVGSPGMEPSQPPSTTPTLHKQACTLCAKRKIRCDRLEPCSNCVKSDVHCGYQPPAPRQRHRRKRLTDEDVRSRLKRYEKLMQENNIDFRQHDDMWIPSRWQKEIEEGKPHTLTGRVHTVSAHPSPSLMRPSQTDHDARFRDQDLWTTLSPDLRNPPAQCFMTCALGNGYMATLFQDRRLARPLTDSATAMSELFNPTSATIASPEPGQAPRLWQTFVENVNPLTKIIHVPTLQQQLFNANWDIEALPKSTAAVMLGICALGVTALRQEECVRLFGEDRHSLLRRYRAATFQALVAAELFTTKSFEVLQAFVLLLLTDPDSDVACTLVGAATKIGYRMGLHRDVADPKMPFFDREMRIRLLWQLRSLEARSRQRFSSPGRPVTDADFGVLPLPLNVNDSDLHPGMAGPPVEHTGPTEMLYVLMKYDVTNWLRSSPDSPKILLSQSMYQEGVDGPELLRLRELAVGRLEAIYADKKYLGCCDKRIPFHAISADIACFVGARMRFHARHPRNRPEGAAPEDSALLFEYGVALLDLGSRLRASPFAPQMYSHVTARSQVDAFVYVVSELRRRAVGEKVETAWRLAGKLYESWPELIEDAANPLYTALGDLMLEAWEARQGELARSHRARTGAGQGGDDGPDPPGFIKQLQAKRRKGQADSLLYPSEDSAVVFGLLGDDVWNDLLQI